MLGGATCRVYTLGKQKNGGATVQYENGLIFIYLVNGALCGVELSWVELSCVGLCCVSCLSVLLAFVVAFLTLIVVVPPPLSLTETKTKRFRSL